VQGYADPSSVLDIYTNLAVVNKAKIANLIKPLFSLNVTFTCTITGGTTLQATTQFVITKTPLNLNVACNFPNCVIPFNETMVLDASSSNDPDQPTKRLQYAWQVKEGANSSLLVVDPFKRLLNGYSIGFVP